MRTDDYVKIINNGGISIGIIPGIEKILYIKTGQGGTIYGEENKYLDLASEVNERYGLSVFVSATESDSKEVYEREMCLLSELVPNEKREIYYLGVSKGGLIGIWYGKDNPVLNNILTINAPLMINFYSKTLPNIKALTKDRLTMIYGSLDPSFKYIPFIKKHTDVRIIDGADHNLCGSSESISDIVLDWLEKSLSTGDLEDSLK